MPDAVAEIVAIPLSQIRSKTLPPRQLSHSAAQLALILLLGFGAQSRAGAQTQPRFYGFCQAEFSDLSALDPKKADTLKWERMEQLRKKYQKKKFSNQIIIPTSAIRDTILPRPGEKLWAFEDSKLLSVTEPEKYYILFPDAGGPEELWFSVKGHAVNGGYLFVAVPSGVKKEDLPKVCGAPPLTKDEQQRLLKWMDGEDQSQVTPVPTSTATSSPTSTPTPTPSPTPTFQEKFGAFLGKFSFHHAPTATPAEYPSRPETPPFSWSRDGTVLQSYDFPKEKVEILLATATQDHPYGGTGPMIKVKVRKTFCLIGGMPFDLRKLIGETDEDPEFELAIQVMGKNYLVFDAGSSGGPSVFVCRVDPSGLTVVYSTGISTD